MKRKHKSVHAPKVIQEDLIEVRPVHVSGTKAFGPGFLIVGSALVILSLVLSVSNKSLADWVSSVFFQFLPGLILFISGTKVLKS
jgi:hypothetical protein